jgi:tyrosine-protein kinase Etk/Wzc
MTVREFLRTVWSGKYIVVACVLVAVVGAWLYVDRQGTLLESEAVVSLGVDGDGEVTIDASGGDVTDPEVLEAAAAALGVDPADLPEISGESGEGGAIRVSARSADPEELPETVDAVAEAFAAHVSALRDRQVTELQEQRTGYEESLKPVQERLSRDPEDLLAGVEQETIVSGFGGLAKQIVELTAITTPAEVTQTASAPSVPGVGAAAVLPVAALAGLVLGVALALARRGLDFRVRDAANASALADVPVLASLFGVRQADKTFRHGGVLPVSSRDATPFTESIRELRTAVGMASATPQRVVVVTAADPRPPRTFITANLAASFALSGLRTIVVSGDLRRSNLDEFLPGPEGAADSGTEPRPTLVANLELVRIYDDTLDPADYLATTQVRDLVESLRERADVVVIDAPPALAAADATILGRYADGVVLVVSAGKTPRGVLAEAATRLRINNVPLMGVALAGVASDRRKLYATTYEAEHPANKVRRLIPRSGGRRGPRHQPAPAPADPVRAGQPRRTPAWPAVPAAIPPRSSEPDPRAVPAAVQGEPASSGSSAQQGTGQG